MRCAVTLKGTRWSVGAALPSATLLSAALLSAASLAPGLAAATCGLDACPYAPPVAGTSDALGLRAGAGTRVTGFSLDATSGLALETPLRLDYVGFGGWVVGASVPVIVLMLDGVTRAGVGNAVVSGERWLGGADLGGALGVQVELPVGSSAVAADHLELLPYLRVEGTRGRFGWSARAGYRHAVSGAEDHDHEHAHDDDHADAHDHPATDALAAVFVESHGDREVVYQGVAMLRLVETLTVSALLDGQQVLDDAATDRAFVQAGGRLGWQADATRVFAQGLLPLASRARLDWRAEAGLAIDF